jgi:hypothetical protein
MVWQLAVFFIACGLVAAGCLVPNRWLPHPLPNDKLLHFGACAALSALALPLADNGAEVAWLLAAILLGSVVVECLQHLLPDRRFCWRDLVANAGGIGAVGLVAGFFHLL